MFASGDGGVWGDYPGLRSLKSCDRDGFGVVFPSASPWVTAVGGTMSNPEVCWEEKGYSPSGGFSNYWARPSYQNAAVEAYFSANTSLPKAGLYNRTGAGFPDVAAQAVNFPIFLHPDEIVHASGTSMASPTFTGIIGLVNEVRLALGKRSLGYLNPLIYKVLGPKGAFNDITSGSNPGCGTSGFHAVPGWDPVTGFGTPNYKKIVAIVSELP